MKNNNRETIMKFTQIIGPMFKALFKFEQEISTILTDNTLDVIDAKCKIDDAKDQLTTSLSILLMAMADDDATKTSIIAGTNLLRPYINELLEIEVECVRGTVFKAIGQVETGTKIYDYTCKKTINFVDEMMEAAIKISEQVQQNKEFNESATVNDAQNKLSEEIINVVKSLEGTKGVGVAKDKVISEVAKVMNEKNEQFSKLRKENNR